MTVLLVTCVIKTSEHDLCGVGATNVLVGQTRWKLENVAKEVSDDTVTEASLEHEGVNARQAVTAFAALEQVISFAAIECVIRLNFLLRALGDRIRKACRQVPEWRHHEGDEPAGLDEFCAGRPWRPALAHSCQHRPGR